MSYHSPPFYKYTFHLKISSYVLTTKTSTENIILWRVKPYLEKHPLALQFPWWLSGKWVAEQWGKDVDKGQQHSHLW